MPTTGKRVRRVLQLVVAVGLLFAVVQGVAVAGNVVYKNSDANNQQYYSSGSANIKGGYAEKPNLFIGGITIQTYRFTPPATYSIFATASGTWWVDHNHTTATSHRSRCRWTMEGTQSPTRLYCYYRN